MPHLPILLLFAVWSMLSPPTAAAQQRIRLGTWNLEQLGFRREPRNDDDYRAIAAVIRRARIDVLAVQEIGGPKPLSRVCSALGDDYDFVLGSTGAFRSDPGRISVGFVWNESRVQLVQAEELLDLPREVDGLPIFHRIPVTAVFKSRQGGLDFRAITVHLKAGRGTTNESKRKAEVAALCGYLTGLRDAAREDRDVVVLGDFNHTYGAPAYVEFMKHRVVGYVTPERLRPTILHFDAPIDHVALAPGLREELVENSHAVHDDDVAKDREGWRKSCSDHIPVTIDLEDARDGDPDAEFAPINARYRLGPGGFAAAESGTRPEPPTTGSGSGRATEISSGARVRVTVRGNGTYDGMLIAPLAEWVHLQLADGSRVAIPAHHVWEIKAPK